MNTQQIGWYYFRLILIYVGAAFGTAVIDSFYPGKYTALTALVPELAILAETLITIKRNSLGVPKIKRVRTRDILLTAAAAGCLYVIIAALGLPFVRYGTKSYAVMQAELTQLPAAVSVIITCVIAPAIEEAIFRGVLFQSYRKQLPYIEAALLSAALFAGFHMDITEIPYTFAEGLAAAAAMEISGNLSLCVLLHALTNLIGSLFLYVPGLMRKSARIRNEAVLYFEKKSGYGNFPRDYALIVVLAVLCFIVLLFMDKILRKKVPLFQQMSAPRPKIFTVPLWIAVILIMTVTLGNYQINLPG